MEEKFLQLNFPKYSTMFMVYKTEVQLYKAHKTIFFVNLLKNSRQFIIYKNERIFKINKKHFLINFSKDDIFMLYKKRMGNF